MMFNSLYRLILFGSLLILVRTLPTSFGDHVDDGNHQLKESQNGNEISLIKGNEISLPSAIDQFYTELFNADFSTLKRRIGCEKGFTRMKVTRTQKFEIEKDSFLIRRIVWQSKYTACVPDHLVDRVREIQRRHPTDDKQTELSRDLGEKHQLQSVTPELYYSTVINSDMAKEIDPSHGDYPVAVPTLFDLEVEQLDSQLANSFEDVNDAPGVIHSSLQRNQRNRRAPSDKRSARSPTARDRGRTSRPDQRRPKRRLDERQPGRKPNRPHERHPDRQPHHRDHRRRRHHRDHRHPRHHRRHPHSHGRDWWRLRHGRDWRRPKWYPSWWQAREPLTGVKSIVPVVPIDVEPVVTPVAVPRVVVAPTTDVDVVVKPGESELAESDVHSSQLVVDQIVAAPQPLSNSHSENHLRRWIPSPTREQLDANIIDHLSITPHESYQPAPPIPFKEGRISKFSSVSSLVNSHDPSEVSSILQSPRRAPPIDTRLRRPPRTPTPARREDSSSPSPWRRGRQPHRRPLPDSSRRRPLPNDTRRRPGRRPLPSPSRRRGPWGPGRPRPFPRPGPFPFPPFGPQPFRPYPQPRPRPIPVVPFEPYPDDSEVDVGPDVIVQPVNPVVIVPVEPLGQEKEAPIPTPVNNGLIEAISDQMSNVTTKL